MAQYSRRCENPECISLQAQRAQARATRSRGQTPACFFSQVFYNGQSVPDSRVFILQRRNLATGKKRRKLFPLRHDVCLKRVQRFVKGNIKLAQQDPRP